MCCWLLYSISVFHSFFLHSVDHLLEAVERSQCEINIKWKIITIICCLLKLPELPPLNSFIIPILFSS